MKKIFVFWAIISLALITGAAAVIYGKMLLKEEEQTAEILRAELAELADARIAAAVVAESYREPARIGLAEERGLKENQTGPAGPHRHTLPTMPRLYKPAQDTIYE